MKKLLILAGSAFQVPVIKYAKSKGYYVITCDYVPENPGHKFSDEYYNVSTTDKEAVLELSRKMKIDGILCFASDPAAPTAAYVAEKLNLPGNPYAGIVTLGEKHHWREFLRKHGFNTPKAKFYSSIEEVREADWKFPVMVKPVDSAGSKGVTKVLSFDHLAGAFELAVSFSRSKIIIVEEFVERVGPQIGGDGFYGADRLEFVCFGDQVVDVAVNPYVPCGMKFPAAISDKLESDIWREIERALQLLNVKNLSFNLEVMIDRQGRVYLMELGPRNGGNCIPEVIQNYTGVNLVALAVESAMGNTLPIKVKKKSRCFAYYALHSRVDGVYQGYEISEHFKGHVNDSYIFMQKGDHVGVYNGSHQTIGVLLLEFENRFDMDDFFLVPERFIRIAVN